MTSGEDLYQSLGEEAGCARLAQFFYARVAVDANLKKLFPGKSLHCATKELSAFLVQFFDGDEGHMQDRWWLSLKKSHARFKITEDQRVAWLAHMGDALESVIAEPAVRAEFRTFFEAASLYLVGSTEPDPVSPGLVERWAQQRSIEQLIECIGAGRDAEAIALCRQHATRSSVTVGILAIMMGTGREQLIGFILESLERNPSFGLAHFNGRALIHFAAGVGCLPVLNALLVDGSDANSLDRGGHAPLYRAANECRSDTGPDVVRALVRHGALINHAGGVMRSTALHAAARHGNLAIAIALVDEGACVDLRDARGFSAIDRAKNCRRLAVVTALES